MIGQYLLNTNESVTIYILQKKIRNPFFSSGGATSQTARNLFFPEWTARKLCDRAGALRLCAGGPRSEFKQAAAAAAAGSAAREPRSASSHLKRPSTQTQVSTCRGCGVLHAHSSSPVRHSGPAWPADA